MAFMMSMPMLSLYKKDACRCGQASFELMQFLTAPSWLLLSISMRHESSAYGISWRPIVCLEYPLFVKELTFQWAFF